MTNLLAPLASSKFLNVLVVGANGYLGTAICNAFLRTNSPSSCRVCWCLPERTSRQMRGRSCMDFPSMTAAKDTWPWRRPLCGENLVDWTMVKGLSLARYLFNISGRRYETLREVGVAYEAAVEAGLDNVEKVTRRMAGNWGDGHEA
ncbi:hypothetical protein QBC41DRAFT_34531 [Cercophora samala]|uniref:NAD-dependent epimerase/dehydratase domain-containing protein n=1 Tax=Cercophora samala TaxID=330535 RepID=A0AA39ZJF2_9PEZI|nr:hypothetical protein QBC41DRAFT_34531 [Cercophora samala]